ncbi:hypothetical protein GALMADRAFT_278669 [Galerina marginata CBS 339.88]|uniref:Heterokaryon incompatibility domain-containing protein n=1 Tax=Galerina marginata (strain CBS 339.88) TaxID=685588 RepID=A0A067T597_GALM3|nr:hypothetical protein GALMADRAFT_278669 [Galerina marginata CBS 339.88]
MVRQRGLAQLRVPAHASTLVPVVGSAFTSTSHHFQVPTATAETDMSTTRAPPLASFIEVIALDPIFDYTTIADRREGLRNYIKNAYSGGELERSATLMDGTQYMILRSLSTACETELPIPLPSSTPSPSLDGADGGERPRARSDNLSFQKCRQCAGEYVFQLQSGTGSITVIAGAPKPDATPYKTMSYVWGELPESPLTIPCLQCGHVTRVPMASAQRFHNLMELGGQGNTIWLDALSIDQFDRQEVSEHIAIMGRIYKSATCVSVLLPASDQIAYELLKDIEGHAKVILYHHQHFIDNADFFIEDPSSGERFKLLTTECQLFLENLKRLGEHLSQFVYWSRAWTFQEWALATDLEVAVEGGAKGETCFNLKSLVLGAAMLISRYKTLDQVYAEINVGEGLSRGMIPPLFNSIKALFPDEDLFLSFEEIDVKEASFQANFPHFRISHLLGVRSIPPLVYPSPGTDDITSVARSDSLASTRARLILLLSAFASSKREAKHEADLVACWASMCNIAYAYDREDDFGTALKKAVKALRVQGIVIYNFVPDTKLNAMNRAEFPGAPIFTGRADTVSHLIHSLNQVCLPTEWNDGGEDAQLTGMKTVLGSKIEESIALDGDLGVAMAAFSAKAVYGEIPGLEGFMFWTVERAATAYLEKVSVEQRAKARMVVVKIPFYKHNSQPSHDLFTWAIVPKDVALEEIIICREPMNGTLTLVVKRDGQHRIVAYLTLSDNLSGTFLVNTNEAGQIDLTLRIQERADAQHVRRGGHEPNSYTVFEERAINGVVLNQARP